MLVFFFNRLILFLAFVLALVKVDFCNFIWMGKYMIIHLT